MTSLSARNHYWLSARSPCHHSISWGALILPNYFLRHANTPARSVIWSRALVSSQAVLRGTTCTGNHTRVERSKRCL
jgi:hypothetical protein